MGGEGRSEGVEGKLGRWEGGGGGGGAGARGREVRAERGVRQTQGVGGAKKEGAEASKSGSFKDEREWGRRCFEDLDHRRMGRPATSTWSTDFLLREGSSREEIGKRLKNKSTREPNLIKPNSAPCCALSPSCA